MTSLGILVGTMRKAGVDFYNIVESILEGAEKPNLTAIAQALLEHDTGIRFVIKLLCNQLVPSFELVEVAKATIGKVKSDPFNTITAEQFFLNARYAFSNYEVIKAIQTFFSDNEEEIAETINFVMGLSEQTDTEGNAPPASHQGPPSDEDIPF